MRASIPAVLFTLALLAAAPMFGDSISTGDLTFSLDSSVGSGYPTFLPPDADTCLQPNCVLFTGTLTNTDNDPTNSFPMLLSGISVVFDTSPANGLLSIDNTFYENVPALSTDPGFATDNTGNPADNYYGPVFGIDIAPDTTPGMYTGTVTISGSGGLGDQSYGGFTISQEITVDVLAPEPGAAGLLLAGLLSFAIWRGAKRKCVSSEVSR